MADRDLRSLERLYNGGDRSVIPALNGVRRRLGLSIIREKIVHYLKTDHHHRLDNDGKIDPRVDRWPVYGVCGQVELWPRHNLRKSIHYTHLREGVTCKTCLRCLASPKFVEGAPRLHYAQETPPGIVWNTCGGTVGRSTTVLEDVGCRGCLRRLEGADQVPLGNTLNARGRRRLRRQQMFALRYAPSSQPLF
jgi:hypothetical protein